MFIKEIMTPIPESGVDYLILSKEEAIALERYFRHQYVHYDEPVVHAAMDKISKFVERVERVESNESSKDSGIGIGESRIEDDQSGPSGTNRNAEV